MHEKKAYTSWIFYLCLFSGCIFGILGVGIGLASSFVENQTSNTDSINSVVADHFRLGSILLYLQMVAFIGGAFLFRFGRPSGKPILIFGCALFILSSIFPLTQTWLTLGFSYLTLISTFFWIFFALIYGWVIFKLMRHSYHVSQ